MLGPRPGAKKRANKLNVSGLGRSLVNQKKKEEKEKGTSDRYTTDIHQYGSGSTLRSVTEQRPLDELLSTAELSGKDFTTERTAAIKVVNRPDGARSKMGPQEHQQLIQQHYENAGKLTVPRRPKWSKSMSAEELDRLEKEAFLAWRRSLASLQENPQLKLTITPFERNLEVWRQLWRVIERSHLIVQIVDARNPLLYRSEDLDKYVQSWGSKNTLLLVNKADLLSDSQRKAWQEYFVKNNIAFAFFSARQASESLDQEANDSNRTELQNTTEILSVSELEALFKQAAPQIDQGTQLQIGLVGYPNVGKSSTINALIGAKKVSVSSTPGKTKHFQTILLTKELMLCDCPGLVFPNFAQTKAELVCQGVLPIDQLREYLGPTSLVVERIPRNFLEGAYGIRLTTDPVTALDLLSTYAKYRGFNRTGGGEPDTSRAARLVLKDYVNAKLPFVMPPPSYEGSSQEFNEPIFAASREEEVGKEIDMSAPGSEDQLSQKMEKVKMQDELMEDELDRDFFTSGGNASSMTQPFHLRNKSNAESDARPNGKASKKHHKGRKVRG